MRVQWVVIFSWPLLDLLCFISRPGTHQFLYLVSVPKQDVGILLLCLMVFCVPFTICKAFQECFNQMSTFHVHRAHWTIIN
jgi:hypothetical protein